MKMHYYLRHWGLNISRSTKFIQNTIRQMIRYTYATMRNKASNRIAKASGGCCDVQEGQVLWLGMHAFHTVLSRKPHTYPQLIKALEFDMSLPRQRRLRKQFRGIVKEGLNTLTLLAF
ncbi:hypothetical protein B0H21DRAFT_780275 [Amylocystis lapponica]|nr:hypothetical protein B0H21DRAFT_780275 [Amylocystis lapponica]